MAVVVLPTPPFWLATARIGVAIWAPTLETPRRVTGGVGGAVSKEAYAIVFLRTKKGRDPRPLVFHVKHLEAGAGGRLLGQHQ